MEPTEGVGAEPKPRVSMVWNPARALSTTEEAAGSRGKMPALVWDLPAPEVLVEAAGAPVHPAMVCGVALVEVGEDRHPMEDQPTR